MGKNHYLKEVLSSITQSIKRLFLQPGLHLQVVSSLNSSVGITFLVGTSPSSSFFYYPLPSADGSSNTGLVALCQIYP